MISIVQYKTSSLIKCLEEKGLDKLTAHSLAFLILYSRNEMDLSGFKPTKDGVIYTEYVNAYCGDDELPNFNYPELLIRTLAVKVWMKLTGSKVSFTEDELKVLKELGVKI